MIEEAKNFYHFQELNNRGRNQKNILISFLRRLDPVRNFLQNFFLREYMLAEYLKIQNH